VEDSTITQLRKENEDLRQLVLQLSKIVIRSLMDYGRDMPPPAAMSPTEIVPHLRELAIRCAHLSRESADRRSAQELESVSVELADAAERLAAVFAIGRSEREAS
jgi:hypothetical protein